MSTLRASGRRRSRVMFVAGTVTAVVVAIGAAVVVVAQGSDPGLYQGVNPTLTDSPPQAPVQQPPRRSPPVSGAQPTGPVTSADIAREAPSQVRAERPRTIALPSEAQVAVRTASTGRSGLLQLPTNINHAGWWDGSAKLGDPLGTIVVAAHVDSFTQGLGVFAELLSVTAGQTVELKSATWSQQFRIVRAELVPKASLSATSPLYSAQTQGRLVLITCGGEYNRNQGGYEDNMVVVAEPVGALQAR